MRFNHEDSGIRRAAAYPGERIGESVKAGEVVGFTETATVQHTHIDGNSYPITFFRLADGRGWVHDFNPNKIGQPAFVETVKDGRFGAFLLTYPTHIHRSLFDPFRIFKDKNKQPIETTVADVLNLYRGRFQKGGFPVSVEQNK